MATRIADQVTAELGGRSLRTVHECTVDNPLGQQKWIPWRGPSIRSVADGEKIYATYEETPYARAQLEVLKFMVGAGYDVASVIPKLVLPLKVPVQVGEPVVDIVISLKDRKETLDRTLRDINNEQMRQTLIKSWTEREIFNRFPRGTREGPIHVPSKYDSETLP